MRCLSRDHEGKKEDGKKWVDKMDHEHLANRGCAMAVSVGLTECRQLAHTCDGVCG